MHKPNERYGDTQKLQKVIKKTAHTPRTDCSRNSAMVSVLSESIDRANINSPSTSMKFSFSRSRRRQSGCRTRDYTQTNTHIHTQIAKSLPGPELAIKEHISPLRPLSNTWSCHACTTMPTLTSVWGGDQSHTIWSQTSIHKRCVKLSISCNFHISMTDAPFLLSSRVQSSSPVLTLGRQR